MNTKTNRELGYIETLCHQHNEELYGTTKISQIVEVKGPLNFALWKQALESAYKRQTLLQAAIKRGEKNFYFDFSVDFNEIPISKKTISRAEDALATFETEIDKPLICNKYLWRATYLEVANDKNTNFFILTINHSIADGISLAYFSEELLELCKQIKNGEQPDLTPYPIRESMEKLMPGSVTFAEYLAYWQDYYAKKRAAEKIFAKKITTQDTPQLKNPLPEFSAEEKKQLIASLPFAENSSFSKRKHRTIDKFLTADKIKAIKDQARNENTTLNSAFGAAMLKAAQQQFPAPLAWKLFTAVDFRIRKDPQIPRNELGCYTFTPRAEFDLDVEKADFWQLARNYQEKLHNEIAKQHQHMINDATLDDIKRFGNSDHLRNATQFEPRILLTNLGQLNFTRDTKPFKISSLRFVSNQVASEYILTLAANTIEERCNLNFCYVYPLVTEKWMKSFVKNFLQILLASVL